MERRGLAPSDSTNGFGFYTVRLREALRPERPAQIDTLQLEAPPIDFDRELEEVRGVLDRILNSKQEPEGEQTP